MHRLVRTLTERGFLEQSDDTQRYRIGPRAFSVGRHYVGARGLVDVALPVLQRLASEHELNAYLGVLSDAAVIYLVALQSDGPIVIRVAPGARAQVHSTALGKVLLAAQPDDAVRRLLGRSALPRLTPKTVTDPAALVRQMATVRRQGYAISDEENLPGVFAVGAPVRDAAGHVVAAISGARPRYLTPATRVRPIARLVLEAAQTISSRLGHEV